MSSSTPAGKAAGEATRFRAAVFLVLALPLWGLLLVQSVHTSWTPTERVYPPLSVERFEPLRRALQGVERADLFAGYDNDNRRRRAFWDAQFTLAPTVLSERGDAATVLQRARRVDPHVLVVEFPSHEAFVRFRERYARRATRFGRAISVQDLGNGIGLLESHGED